MLVFFYLYLDGYLGIQVSTGYEQQPYNSDNNDRGCFQ